MGRVLAERLGYPAGILDRLPSDAVDSFAGVGYAFDLARLAAGEEVLDLGSGAGMDAFFAALQVGAAGRVVGVDMTAAQLEKARSLRQEVDGAAVTFVEARIEKLPFPDRSFDVVISNGVVNLSPDKARVFAEAARVLRPGGRLAISDIVTETALSERIVGNSELWAACIGGAAQQDDYQRIIEEQGLRLELMKRNAYRFLSERSRNASDRYGVKSVSILARKAESAGRGRPGFGGL
ncbi:methyltransferase domain-containing protein [Agromyces sp. H66]|uniref:methyltransferase domain-containing protein n=1 Tax=Agromyces sp. H66 TaxID=2529859 RepID=UPI0020BEDFC0|nr:methyltransferase domain-containing protein [Agromyces sp. H66]